MRLIFVILGCLLASVAHAALNTPVVCAQQPALAGAVTTSAGSCVTSIVASGSGQKQPTAPVAPASKTQFKMQGLAGAITPKRTGQILIVISGDFISSAVTAGDGIQIQLSYGTGTAPVNTATLTGTQVGSILEYTNPTTVTAADVFVPFSVNAVVTGLTPNTAYWIDLAAVSVAVASTVGVTNVSISVIEF